MTAAGTPTAAAPVTVLLPEALVRLFPGSVRRVELRAATVAEAIEALDASWPGMRDRLCESPRRARRHINIFVGGEPATLDTPLTPGTEITIMTAIRGG